MLRLSETNPSLRAHGWPILLTIILAACSGDTGQTLGGTVDAGMSGSGDVNLAGQDQDTTVSTLDTTMGKDDTSRGPDDIDMDDPAKPCTGRTEGSACDDGNPCTLSDTCQAGLCVGGSNDPCNAEGTCRSGSCDPAVGCVYEDVTDGTACNVACFGAASCQAGTCVADADTSVVCPAPTAPCVAQLGCEMATGECTVEIYVPIDTPCDSDENTCSLEQCDGGGSCVSLETTEDCAEQNLDNPCWTWTCTPKTGCVQTAFLEGGSCDDNNPCSVNDTCLVNDLGQELCLGAPILIDDGNPCTDDACVQGVVSHDPIDGAVCESECGTGLCDGSECVSTEGCGCTKDVDCVDVGDVCTGLAVCDDGECEIDPSTALTCPDVDHPCAVAICDAALGLCALAPAPEGTACDEAFACIEGGLCEGTTCAGGSMPSCDDDDPCTVDACVLGVGCAHEPSGAEECLDDMTGLAAWYRFEETTGEVLDSSGNGHHGAPLGNGLTRGTDGAVGLGIAFSGGDGRVQIPAHPDFDFTDGATLEAWVWLGTTDGVGQVVSRGTGNNDNCVLMNSSQGNMQTIFQAPPGTTNVTSASGEIPVMTWTHVAVTNDGSTLSLYFDGVLNTTATGGMMVALTSDLFIGQREQMIFAFNGRIDEVKWWTVVRSPQEICLDAEGDWNGSSCSL